MRMRAAFTPRWISLCAVALVLWRAGAAGQLICAGVTEPVFTVTLSLAVPGIVMTKNFKEGDFVHSNETILVLDKRLEELEVDRRKLLMENRKAELDSTKTVFEKGVSVTRDELLKKQTEYEVARADYQSALEMLQRRSLTAPAEGVITEFDIHAGEACAAYQPLVKMVDTRQCYFIANVDAGYGNRLQLGEDVPLEIEHGADPVKLKGEVVFISPVVDQASGLQRIKVKFANPDGKVRPGVAGQMVLP